MEDKLSKLEKMEKLVQEQKELLTNMVKLTPEELGRLQAIEVELFTLKNAK